MNKPTPVTKTRKGLNYLRQEHFIQKYTNKILAISKIIYMNCICMCSLSPYKIVHSKYMYVLTTLITHVYMHINVLLTETREPLFYTLNIQCYSYSTCTICTMSHLNLYMLQMYIHVHYMLLLFTLHKRIYT